MSIRTKLTILFVAVALLPMVCTGAVGFLHAKRLLTESALAGLDVLVGAKEGEMLLYLEGLRSRSRDFASDGLIRTNLEGLHQRGEGIDAVALRQHLVRNKQVLDPTIQAIDVLDAHGTIVASTEPTRVGIDYLHKQTFFSAMAGDTYIEVDRIKEHEGTIHEQAIELNVAAPVHSHNEPSEIVGVLINHHDITAGVGALMVGAGGLAAGSSVRPRGIGQTGETYLVGRERLMMNESLFLPDAAFTQRVETKPVQACFEEGGGKAIRGVWPDYRGVSVAGASRCLRVDGIQWMLVSEQDEDETFAQVHTLTRLGAVMGVVVLFAVVLVGVVIAEGISKPIRALEAGTRVIGGGNLDYTVGTDARDEIGQLSRGFDQMVASLRAAQEELNREVAERRRAEEIMARKKMEADLLHRAAALAAEPVSFDEALQRSTDLVCDAVGWPIGHVYRLATDGSGELEPTTIWHVKDPERYAAFREVTEQTRFAPGIGLPGRILASGKPAWIVNVQKDSNFPRARLCDHIGVKGAFGFPITVSGETLVVLEFFTNEELEPDEDLLKVFWNMGHQIGRVLERKRAEEHIQQLNANLNQSNLQLEAANNELEAFSSSVSHDLRAPLRAIDGFSQILLEDYAARLDAEGQRVISVVRSNTQKMGTLIDDLLDFSRLGRREVTYTRVDMGALVQDVLKELKADVAERTVQCEIAPLPSVRGDRAMLRQVWQNLLSNAMKYTRSREIAVITVDGQMDNHEAQYSVKDNGVGFDMRYVDKLFGVFQRLHRQEDFEGTGVGLALVQRVVHRHGGRVWAEGEVDKGARFHFALPHKEEA